MYENLEIKLWYKLSEKCGIYMTVIFQVHKLFFYSLLG